MRQDVTGFFTMLQGARARGGDSGPSAEWWEFGPGRGVEIQDRARGGGNSGPGRGVVGIRDPVRGGVGIRARARGGDFFGKMENFLPFCRFFAV